MAKLVYALNQSLGGYVDHMNIGPPDPGPFCHFIEWARDLTDVVYASCATGPTLLRGHPSAFREYETTRTREILHPVRGFHVLAEEACQGWWIVLADIKPSRSSLIKHSGRGLSIDSRITSLGPIRSRAPGVHAGSKKAFGPMMPLSNVPSGE